MGTLTNSDDPGEMQNKEVDLLSISDCFGLFFFNVLLL